MAREIKRIMVSKEFYDALLLYKRKKLQPLIDINKKVDVSIPDVTRWLANDIRQNSVGKRIDEKRKKSPWDWGI